VSTQTGLKSYKSRNASHPRLTRRLKALNHNICEREYIGLCQQGLLCPPAAEPFLPFHSIPEQTLAQLSPKNVLVQILVANGTFFVWGASKKDHRQATGRVRRRGHRAWVRRHGNTSRRGVPAVAVYWLLGLTGCWGLPVVEICWPSTCAGCRVSAGRAGLSAVQVYQSPRFTGCWGLPAVEAYRLLSCN
jgi:hypothetical protein